jgi:uncharacterized protein with HEPN domain
VRIKRLSCPFPVCFPITPKPGYTNTLTRLIEIIGEAAHRISAETQQMHPDIPWPHIVGMRNRLDVIDWDLLWETITSELPPLIVALQRILK